jgi:hypothetical protein
MTLAHIRERAPTWYTLLSGGFLLLQGTSTLLFLLYPPLDHAFPFLLQATRMIPIHSTLHIVTGILALAVVRWGGKQTAWWFALLFGIFYTTLGLLGLLTGQTFGLGLQPFDHPFHLVAGMPGLVAAAIGYGPAHSMVRHAGMESAQ